MEDIKSHLKITRARNYGWRYIIKGDIAGFELEADCIDEENFDTLIQEVTKMVSLHVSENSLRRSTIGMCTPCNEGNG